MRSLALPRVALVLSLLVLGGSLAVLATVTGVGAALSPGDTQEFAIEDGSLVATIDGQTRTVVEDVRTVERVEITDRDGRVVVRTTPREPPELDRSTRERAKRVVASDDAVAEAVDASGGALYTIRPIPEGASSDRAAVLGADPGTTWERLAPANASAFAVRERDDGVVLERTEQPVSDERALVVVDPIEVDSRYSAVVNLDDEVIEAFVQSNPAGR